MKLVKLLNRESDLCVHQCVKVMGGARTNRTTFSLFSMHREMNDMDGYEWASFSDQNHDNTTS